MGVLSLAAAQGDVPMCELLLEYGADISQRDTVGATPLIHAAARGATAAVQLLLASKAGANLGRKWLLQQATEGGETAVMAAAKGGHLDTLQPTPPMPGPLQRGCCPAPCGVLAGLCLDGGDALMYVAAGAGSIGVVAWLLKQGVGAKCLAARDQHSAVFAAVRQGQADMVRYVAQRGASLEARDERGRTPLAWAAAAGLASMVRLLVGLGADLLAADSSGMVPRQLAHAADQRSTAELLTQLARDKLLHCSDDGSC
ncbi:hypothetical protein OEZ85_001996 [Tetradesmus obliquus]|uniref:Uncharacterized protein n=1 Tax=Tetradesmus obliquus TaxID=3088 RepID=A0ABY8U1R8_TETOB|nr:hypothetical protein OEZ85_001996 [Tetradesmus obliquus]